MFFQNLLVVPITTLLQIQDLRKSRYW